MFSSCALHVTRVCSLAAVLRPSAAAATGSAADGRAGAFGARWHLHWHAIVSSRAVPSRASARSQALDATCVSRKNYVVHGGASFCAERKIPTNIAGIADKLTVSFRRANAQEARRASTDRQDTLMEGLQRAETPTEEYQYKTQFDRANSDNLTERNTPTAFCALCRTDRSELPETSSLYLRLGGCRSASAWVRCVADFVCGVINVRCHSPDSGMRV